MKRLGRRHAPAWSPVLAAIASAVALAACAGPIIPPSAPASGATGSDAAAVDAPPNIISANQDGIAVTIALDRSVVEPGQSVLMTATVRNDRPIPTIVGFTECGAPATISGDVAVPWDPTGRKWDGVPGEFKRFALEQGLAAGGVPDDRPVTIYARGEPCEVGEPEIRLGPGASSTALVTWTAQIVEDVPALPGDVPITVGVSYDRPDPLPAPVCNPLCGLRVIPWKSLAANGVIRVAGAPPPILTAGQAVDALLADARFADASVGDVERLEPLPPEHADRRRDRAARPDVGDRPVPREGRAADVGDRLRRRIRRQRQERRLLQRPVRPVRATIRR